MGDIEELIIKKIMRGDNLGGYDIECAAIRAHIRQLEAKISEVYWYVENCDTVIADDLLIWHLDGIEPEKNNA